MIANRKLILTGFMGSGKTTVAHLVSEYTGIAALDMDEVIVQRAGMTIPEIFARMGEAGFRAWEATVCAELGAETQPLIVATGGGALLAPANRRILEQNATMVCLSARPEVIFERLKETGNRPLLAGDNPLQTIQTLLVRRLSMYRSFRWQVDTSDLSPDETARKIIDIWQRDAQVRSGEQMVTTPEGSYPIVIQTDSLHRIGELFDIYGLADRHTVIVTDDNVAPLYGDKVCLPNAALVVMPAGEVHKNLTTVNRLYDELSHRGTDRHSVVVALGGGVVGDTAGYVAATYMRGVTFVQIPTTLLAMVDSSVGGKVGVDILAGKNLVGAFKQPALVLIDPATLKTLPPEERRAGMAEVIKHGLLADRGLFEVQLSDEALVRRALAVKIAIVERDPYEQGERMHLNLGHTFAHAIEQASGYRWRHGDAVGVGLVGAAKLSQRLGFISETLVQFIESTVTAQELPTRYQNLTPEAIWQAMASDKKWKEGRARFVVLRGIGQPDVVQDVPREPVMEVLEALHEHT